MSESSGKTFVIALGGNSILRAHQTGTTEDQLDNLAHTADQLLDLLRDSNRIVITHGNGPQVGNLLLAMEAAKDVVPPLSFDLCGAATGGFMGYMIQNTLANHLRRIAAPHNITTVMTLVVVDPNDPAFTTPSKPIGPFYDAKTAERLRVDKGWALIEDSGRGYRRVVPSPLPVHIQQARIIKHMLEHGEIVIALGGGGIPVIREPNRDLRGIDAVIDKDYASARLAIEIDADVIFMLTAVEHVYQNFGTPHQKALETINLRESRRLLAEGQFGLGSMEPKIRAAIMFLEEANDHSSRQREVIITLPETAMKALAGETGTRITR